MTTATLEEYLVTTGDGSLWQLKEQLKALGGFWTGFCWAFSSETEEKLKQLIGNLPEIQIHKQPLPSGHTFESYRQIFNASFYKKEAAKIENEISLVRLSSDEISNKIAQLIQKETESGSVSKNAQEELHNLTMRGEEERKVLFNLSHRHEKLISAMNHAESMAKVLSSQQSHKIEIKFISEREVNFLLDDAPEMPRLVNFLEDGHPKPFIRKGIVAMLVGAGGAGKTHALTQLAISITTGSNFLGIYPIEEPGHVFIGLGENADEDIHRLLRKIANNLVQKKEATFFEKDPLTEASKRLSVMSFTGMDATFVRGEFPTAFYQGLLDELKAKEPPEGWSCIILDPISRFLGADAETDNAAATQFITLLERLTLELRGKPTVIFGHHMNKGGVGSTNTDQAASRGSSAITDGVRWQANLEKVKVKKADATGNATQDPDADEEPNQYELNKIRIRYVKSNFTALLPPQRLIKDEKGCLFADENSQPIIISTAKDMKTSKVNKK